ncbi:MAG: FAD-binding oxidoreductase [Actinomycetota bacterium]|nr:FAD-binding oxidoreductase [Actinomycetota bacterium]
MHVEVAIIGGGIAGLSCAAAIGSGASVVVLEAEPTLGYHATGRSAALYTECYGAPVIRSLARASKEYLTVTYPELSMQRGLIFVAPKGDAEALDALEGDFSTLVKGLERLSPSEVERACSLFPSSLVEGGVFEPDSRDIDVDALLTTYVRVARAAGTTILTEANVAAMVRQNGRWAISAGQHQVTADIVVNASGAWGDRVAELAGITPLGLRPFARSVFTFDPGTDPQGWPMAIDARERWYMKPEGPLMLASAASEIPSEPRDARPEELDIALGIDKINTATSLEIRSVKNTWAGLRTFTADRVPAIGFDDEDSSFFWLVGQGGYGIKTSPALGRLSAAKLLHQEVPADIIDAGVDERKLDPVRLR